MNRGSQTIDTKTDWDGSHSRSTRKASAGVAREARRIASSLRARLRPASHGGGIVRARKEYTAIGYLVDSFAEAWRDGIQIAARCGAMGKTAHQKRDCGGRDATERCAINETDRKRTRQWRLGSLLLRKRVAQKTLVRLSVRKQRALQNIERRLCAQ